MTALLAVLAVLGAIALIFLGSIWSGYALSALWGWFMVPTFHLPAISIPAAIGVSLVVTYLTHQDFKIESETSEKIAYAILKPLFALLIGAIVRMFL